MELKDVILSTLAEMDQAKVGNDSSVDAHNEAAAVEVAESKPFQESHEEHHVRHSTERDISDEAKYLESIKERLLVLFEGFQSPNNVEIEAKVDLTLNFLEYLLSTIDSRLDKLKKHG